MKTVHVRLSIGFPSAVRTDEIEFEDDMTDAEIEAEVREWAMEHVDWSWSYDEDE